MAARGLRPLTFNVGCKSQRKIRKRMNVQRAIDRILRSKDGSCFTMQLNLGTSALSRLLNPALVSRSVDKAVQFMNDVSRLYPTKPYSFIIENLKRIGQDIEAKRLDCGVGVYISQGETHIIYFPFSITQTMSVGETFETRDLFRLLVYFSDYYVLRVHKEVLTLFHSDGEFMAEVSNEDFPFMFSDYEFNIPRWVALENQRAVNERNQSVVTPEQQLKFFREGDLILFNYLKGTIPLIISGSEKLSDQYKSVSTCTALIVATIHGKDSRLISTQETRHLNNLNYAQKMKTLLSTLSESEKIHSGIVAAWLTAHHYNGLLFAERNYKEMGYLQPGSRDLQLTQPLENFNVVKDAVGGLMSYVHEHGGTVVIVEDGFLKKDKIAFIAQALR